MKVTLRLITFSPNDIINRRALSLRMLLKLQSNLANSRRLPMGKAQSGVTLVGRHWIFKSLQIQLLMHNSIVFSR
jgi:hypothetical protein